MLYQEDQKAPQQDQLVSFKDEMEFADWRSKKCICKDVFNGRPDCKNGNVPEHSHARKNLIQEILGIAGYFY